MAKDVKLSRAEAERLIQMLKKALIDSFNFPEMDGKNTFQVQGDKASDMFTISVFRGKINAKKYSFNAIVSKNGTVLLGLDVSDTGAHLNPDGKKICGSHWHIYTEEHGRRFAVEAPDVNSDEFVENTIKFLDAFNVIKKPMINYQNTLDFQD